MGILMEFIKNEYGKKGFLESLKAKLRDGAYKKDINELDNEGSKDTSLMFIARKDDEALPVAKLLVENGAAVSVGIIELPKVCDTEMCRMDKDVANAVDVAKEGSKMKQYLQRVLTRQENSDQKRKEFALNSPVPHNLRTQIFSRDQFRKNPLGPPLGARVVDAPTRQKTQGCCIVM